MTRDNIKLIEEEFGRKAVISQLTSPPSDLSSLPTHDWSDHAGPIRMHLATHQTPFKRCLFLGPHLKFCFDSFGVRSGISVGQVILTGENKC